jgi:hypothetical protein
MPQTASLPVILICSGCFLALLVGIAFRAITFLGFTARLGFLPKGLTRWLYGMNQTSNHR